MIQCLNYHMIIILFVHVIDLFKWRQNRLTNYETDMQIIKNISLSKPILLQFLQMSAIAMRYYTLRQQNKKMKVMKPHKLIHLLWQYIGQICF